MFVCRHGFFFAVKEVSLLDEGSQGKQRIVQLEQVFYKLFFLLIRLDLCCILIFCLNYLYCFQEISLLSQFQHENIVRYLGTDTVCIFSFTINCTLFLEQNKLPGVPLSYL